MCRKLEPKTGSTQIQRVSISQSSQFQNRLASIWGVFADKLASSIQTADNL